MERQSKESVQSDGRRFTFPHVPPNTQSFDLKQDPHHDLTNQIEPILTPKKPKGATFIILVVCTILLFGATGWNFAAAISKCFHWFGLWVLVPFACGALAMSILAIWDQNVWALNIALMVNILYAVVGLGCRIKFENHLKLKFRS